jgi:lysophospholipase L1-like esterase
MSRFVILGDSVTWGQGLNDSEKIHTIVASAMNFKPSDIILTAHSGAVIGATAKSTERAVNGEVPVPYPTILQQCRGFPGNNEDVALVVVNGGINDVDFRFIINPLTDPGDMHEAIFQHCYLDMKLLLTEIATRFSNPSARILLTSYYPILSRSSSITLVPTFLLLHGVVIPPFIVSANDLAFGRLVANCQQFWEESNACFVDAVDEVNVDLGGSRILFVKIPFKDENAALATDPWLWGINADLSVEDSMRDARHLACDIDEPDLIQREICYRASAGHPNVAGAKQFADAICKVLGV